MDQTRSTWRRRRRRRRNRYNNHIPQELVFDILFRLAVESLLRFKSVCRLWQSIISDPHLIQTHLTNSQKKPYLLLVNNLFLKSSIFSTYPIRLNCSEDLMNLDPLFDYFARMEVIDSCNGILCLRELDGSRHIYLLNPATRQYKCLPVTNITPADMCVKDELLFGFDCISNDYKVVRLLCGYNIISNFGYRVTQAEVYSTNAASWREIQISEIVKIHLFNLNFKLKHACLVQGVLYCYVAGLTLLSDCSIVSFDLHNEEFGSPTFPCKNRLTEKTSPLLNFEGSLAFMQSATTADRTATGLWALDNSAVNSLWASVNSVTLCFGVRSSLLSMISEKFVDLYIWVMESLLYTSVTHWYCTTINRKRLRSHRGSLLLRVKHFSSIPRASFSLRVSDHCVKSQVKKIQDQG